MNDPFNLTETEITYFGLGRDSGLEEGIAKERERIIKLLEAWLDDDYGDFGDTLKLIKAGN